MICAACGESTPGRPKLCPACSAPPALRARYLLQEVIGEGGSGVTFKAVALANERAVCVKELRYSRLSSFEAERLFEREVRVLRQLDHPGIVRYVDDFTAGQGRNAALYLVQELVEGHNLAQEMQQHRYTEREVLEVLAELAEVLAYLHRLSPPVIHRDLKPSNVIRRAADQRLVLVDFGSVRDAIRETVSGRSTVTGTFGYMAPEQLYGRATPACDLYALGVLSVVLLCQRSPAELADERGELDWRNRVPLAAGTEALLTALLERDPLRRLADASEVAQRARALSREEPAPAPNRAPLQAARNAPRVARPPARSAAGRAADKRSGAGEPQRSKPQQTPQRIGRREILHDPPAAGWQPQRSERPVPSGPAPRGSALSKGAAGAGAIIAVAVGLLLFAVFAGGGMEKKEGAVITPAVHGPAGAPAVGGGRKAVARGLKGLTFGMSRSEAVEALPELEGAPEGSLPKISPSARGLGLGGLLVNRGAAAEPMPGVRVRVRTTLAHQPGVCLLDFAVQQRLSRIDCTLDGLGSLEAHKALEGLLLGSLRERNGSETSKAPPSGLGSGGITGLMQKHDGSWRWKDAGATLELRSHFQAFTLGGQTNRTPPTSTLQVVNTSAEHLRVEAALRDKADRTRDRLRAERERADRQRRAEELRRLRAKGAGDDL